MRRVLVLLAALAVGAAPPAGATTAPTLALSQQAKKADVIVRATLGTPSDVTEGEVIWRVYPLTVTETVAGDPSTLPQREGRPALYLLAGLEDPPGLRAGQDTFLLLYSRRLDNPIVGFTQGVYLVENGRVARLGAAPVAATPGPGAATTGSTTPTGTGTATPTTPAGTGAAPGTSTLGGTPAGATAGTATTGSTTPPANTAAGTAAPAPTTPAATQPAANDPNAVPSDLTQFRDALRAARGAQ